MSSSIKNDMVGGSSSSSRDQGVGISTGLPHSESSRTDASSRGGGGVRFRSRESIEEIRRISRISNYNLEEVINYWGDSEEHKLRKQELKMAAEEMQNCRRMSDNMEYTTLGISDKVGEGRAMKRANRIQARNAVLDEQELQYFEGVVDDELLADVYGSTTASAKQSAAENAAKLHNEVENFS